MANEPKTLANSSCRHIVRNTEEQDHPYFVNEI